LEAPARVPKPSRDVRRHARRSSATWRNSRPGCASCSLRPARCCP